MDVEVVAGRDEPKRRALNLVACGPDGGACVGGAQASDARALVIAPQAIRWPLIVHDWHLPLAKGAGPVT